MRNPFNIRKRAEPERNIEIGAPSVRTQFYSADSTTYLKLYEENSIFRRAIDLIASEVVRTPYKIDGPKAELEVLSSYLSKPNFLGDDWESFVFNCAVSLLVYNFCCIEVRKSKDGVVSELAVLEPAYVSATGDSQGHVLGVTYSGTKVNNFILQTLFPSKDTSKLLGSPLTKAILDELSGVSASVSFFVSEQVVNGVPPGVLVVKNLRGDNLERFVSQLFSTVENKEGGLKVVVLGGASPDDIRFVPLESSSARRSIDVDKVLESRVLEFFAIPTSSDPLYVWREKKNERFCRFVKPVLNAVTKIVSTLITEHLKLSCTFEFQVKNVLSLAADEFKALVQTGVISVNEMREMLGISPMEEDIRYLLAGKQVYEIGPDGKIRPTENNQGGVE